jgi:cell division protein FtsQ
VRARRSARAWVAALAGILAVCATTWWVTRSPIFTLRSFRVSGASHVSPERIASLAGIGPQTNVLWVSTRRIERALEGDPWVASAAVQRSLPGAITVAIRERDPVAVAMPGSWLIAGDGVVLGRVRGPTDVPQISPGVSLRPGGRLSLARLQLEVARALPAAFAARVRSIETRPGLGLALVLRSGAVAILGTPLELTAKEASLQAVLAWTTRRGVAPLTIDVRSPEAPSARVRAPIIGGA